MTRSRRRGPRKRLVWVLLIYLLFVIAGAIVLWLVIPEDVKKAIYETYVNPP
jgi:predicted PurR-regulated permease PerM